MLALFNVGGELIIYLFIYCCFYFFCWFVDVFVVVGVVAVCLFFILSLFCVTARFQASTS